MSETAPEPQSPWPFNRSPALIWDPIVQGIAFVAVVSAIFLLWPDIDLWFSGLFYKEGEGFIVSSLQAFRFVRELNSQLVEIVLIAFAVAIVVKLVLPETRTALRPQHMLFAFVSLLVGPGLIVNGLFKAFSGRPRPIQIEAFGSDAPFVGVWDITDYCARNCSFISGEASSALWLVTLVLFLPKAWQGRAVGVMLALCGVLSLNRIAYGGHFLSDVLISWGITLVVIAGLHRLFYVRPGVSNDALEAGLTRAGHALRKPFRHLP